MRPEDLASVPGTEVLIVLLPAVVAAMSIAALGAIWITKGGWNGSFTKGDKFFTVVSAVMAAASIASVVWIVPTTFAEIDAGRQLNIHAVTTWAAEYGVAVDEDQATDIASAIINGGSETAYKVTGPAGEMTLRLEEAGGEYSLSQELGLAPLERIARPS